MGDILMTHWGKTPILIHFFLFALMVLIFTGCWENQKSPWIDSQFESGSIGNIQKIHDAQFDIFLADDNGDDTLPEIGRASCRERV